MQRFHIKRIATLAKIQSAREASYHLSLMDNCQTFSLRLCIPWQCEFSWWYYLNMEVMKIGWWYERKWIWWFATLVIHHFFWFWAIKNQWLWVTATVTVHSSRKKEEIKTVSFLTILRNCLVTWRSLNWKNVWSREKFFGADCWDDCTQKEGGEKLLSYIGREC